MVPQLEPRAEPLIQAHGLSHHFGSLTALDEVDLSLYPGEVLALLGSNGAGKTTLMRILCRLLKPGSGSLSYRHQGIGYCPQKIAVWEDLTCHEQLTFMAQAYKIPKRQIKPRITSLLESLGLHDRHHQRASVLSGGMKRRLGVALAMIHDPPVLILDEPEAGLDPDSRQALRAFLQVQAQDGKAILISTHHMDQVQRVATRVLILHQGKILTQGTPQELVERLIAEKGWTPKPQQPSLEDVYMAWSAPEVQF